MKLEEQPRETCLAPSVEVPQCPYSRYSSYKYFGGTEYREEAGVAWAARGIKIKSCYSVTFSRRRAQVEDLTLPFPLAPVSAAFSFGYVLILQWIRIIE